MDFVTFLLDDGRIRIRICTNNGGSGSAGPKTYGSFGSIPQHWYINMKLHHSSKIKSHKEITKQ
jgi:hypothetical protein